MNENILELSKITERFSGVYQPDGGQIILNGQPVRFNDPSESHQAGAEMCVDFRELTP